MKEYNRKTRKYEEPSTEKVGDLKKRELCRGKKPHDYELALPAYVKTIGDVTPEGIAKYYEVEDEIDVFCNEKAEELERAYNIKRSNFANILRRRREYRCRVCNKLEYK